MGVGSELGGVVGVLVVGGVRRRNAPKQKERGMSEATHVYVGTKDCGCRVCVVTDSPESRKYTAQSIAGYVKDGLQVTRETLEEYRKKPVNYCTHEVPHD